MKILNGIYDHQTSGSISAALRNRRLSLFLSLLSKLETSPIKILDVGGRVAFWESTGLLDSSTLHVEITLLNTSDMEIGCRNSRFQYVVGDARKMDEFYAKEFDVVFSNSVIEHVGSYRDQSLMAAEIDRVGQRYFIQTPNFYFPIEPHFIFPGFHWLPIALRTWLVTHFNLGWYEKFDNADRAEEEVRSIRLMTKKEFVTLFQGSNLFEEKVVGLTKSFVAYKMD
jgi:Methyltransferase domain